MKVTIPLHLVEKRIARYLRELQTAAASPRNAPPSVITISREPGCPGREIADILGTRLGIEVWDKEILDVLASRSHGDDYQAAMFEALDEKKQSAIEALVAEFFGDIEKHTYFYLLPKAIYLIAQNSAIIIGRGAAWLLPDSFRVSLCASPKTRIASIQSRKGVSAAAARDLIKHADHERDAFLKELRNTANLKTDLLSYDVTVNLDRFSPDQAAAVILEGLSQFQRATA